MGRASLYTAVEVYKDGHREVYHRAAEPDKPGWVWTHNDTKRDRKKCSACTDGTLATARELNAGRK